MRYKKINTSVGSISAIAIPSAVTLLFERLSCGDTRFLRTSPYVRSKEALSSTRIPGTFPQSPKPLQRNEAT